MRLSSKLLSLSLGLALTAFGAACGAKQTPEPELPPPVEEAVAEPEPAPPPSAPDEPWRAEQPKPGEPAKIVPPTFESAKLKNGLTVILSRREGLPLVAVHLTQQVGSGSEPAAKAGLAYLTYEMLLQGAGKRDALALADAFADLGTTATPSVSDDGGTVGLSVLKRNLGGALALLSDVIQRPTFPAKEFERQKKARLADLARMAGNPQYLSKEATAEAIFGAQHPYGHLAIGKTETVEKLQLKDVKGFAKANFGPKAAALVFAGDLTLEEAKALAQEHFGKWKGKGRAFKAPKAPKASPRTAVTVVPKEGLGQTVITIGKPGLAAGHPDEWALRIASSVFGGLFSSRLNMNLREDKGYTYGARAYADTRLGAGPVMAASAVRADVTGPSVKEFFAELEGLASRPIEEKEFSDAVEGARRSLPGWFESVEALAGSADSLFLERQPLDRYGRMLAAYDTLTLEQVREVAKKVFVPGEMQIILVGDPTIIAEQVGPLGLGEVPAAPAKAEPEAKKAE
ncbi:MAG: pitrilysin family protein [Deltaproteobacteria bacterium]|nr:pitrilysin family protein [Deltaproteobacteria bacterium]